METKYKIMIGILIAIIIGVIIYLIYRKNKKDKLDKAHQLLVQYKDAVNAGDATKRWELDKQLFDLGFTVVPNVTTGLLEMIDSDKKVIETIGN